MLKYILSYFRDSEDDTDISLDEAYAELEAASENKVATVEELPNIKYPDCNALYNKTGVITSVRGSRYTIDNIYKFQSTTEKFVIGNRVVYKTYTNKGHVNVTDVTISDDWTSPVKDRTTWCTRNYICKVTERKGRQVYLNPGNLSFDLNIIESEFIPIVGDWLQVQAKVEVDEDVTDLSGHVLEIESIHPLCPQIIEGRIKVWSEKTETGIINGTVFFNKDVVPSGYVPMIKDNVVAEIIESDQLKCTHRALKILPEKQLVKNLAFSANDLEEDCVAQDERVSISGDVRINASKLGEIVSFTFELLNESSSDLILLNLTRLSNNSQCKIVQPEKLNDITVHPKQYIEFQGSCCARNMGISKEMFVFTFSDFKIVRWVVVCVESKEARAIDSAGHTYKQPSFKLLNSNSILKGQKVAMGPKFLIVKLPEYPVPRNLLHLAVKCAKEREDLTLIEAVKELKPCLVAPFLFENYEDRFHTLLYLEEIHELLLVENYTNERTCFIKNGEYLMLEIDNLAERRPSLMVGDRIIATNPRTPRDLEGYIHKVGAKHVYLKFAEAVHDSYDGEDVSVRAILSRSLYRRMHQGIGFIVRNSSKNIVIPSRVVEKPPQVKFTYDPYSNDFLNVCRVEEQLDRKETTPTTAKQTENGSPYDGSKLRAAIEALKKRIAEKSDDEAAIQASSMLLLDEPQEDELEKKKNSYNKSQLAFKLEWYNRNLNFYQKEAVRNILLGQARPLPYVIFGPPGTGKTITLVETILQLLRLIPHSRLLVTSPSNSSADLLALRLLDSGVLKPGDLIRLVAYRCIHDNMLNPRLVPYSATVDIAKEGTRCQQKTADGLVLGCSSSVIGRHRITISTCSTAGVLFSLSLSRAHFTHIIVDEAGQANEPEIMIPLSFLNPATGQAILAGDPMQLGPVILSKVALAYGLEEAYLNRILNKFPYVRDPCGFPETDGFDPRLVTRLIYNYRSLPGVLNLYNALFYDGELISTISSTNSKEAAILRQVKDILPCKKDGGIANIVFHGVLGENCQSSDSPSWFNPDEASQIFFYVNELYRLGLKSSDIGIISPYLKQVRVIRSLLNESDFEVPKIGTVEEFQGQEFNVILISTVRSNKAYEFYDIRHKMGFVCNSKRLNVAISRAQVLVIIVGNPNLLSTDCYWRSVIKHCIENGSYIGCDFF